MSFDSIIFKVIVILAKTEQEFNITCHYI